MKLGRLSSVAMASIGSLLFAAAPTGKESWREQGLIFVEHSWNARLHPIPASAVHLNQGFWTVRRRVVTERSLPTSLQLLEERGVVDNFRRLSGRKKAPRRGNSSTDAELYEWIEAASAAIESNETSGIDKNKFRVEADAIASDIAAAQEPDGYLNTYFNGPRAALRYSDLTRSDEGLCLGHLIEAGIDYYRATGSRALLDPATRAADQVVNNFGPAKRPFVTSYPVLEMAFVELFRTTGNGKYLDFTRYLFSGIERDRLKSKSGIPETPFSTKAFAKYGEFEGNPIRALYAASGATDYQLEAGDPAFKRTLDSLWTDLTQRRMSITGGIGTDPTGDRVTAPYDVPDSNPYMGTCAATANIMWSFRMLMLTAGASYADLLERALYNAVNAGMTLGGVPYCRRATPAFKGVGVQVTKPNTEGDCCASAVENAFESVPGLMYASGREGFFVNLYHASEVSWHLANHVPVRLAVATSYPWAGDVRITVGLPRSQDFALNLRWPSWAFSARLAVNGQSVEPINQVGNPGTFLAISRAWHDGDVITLNFGMRASVVASNPLLSTEYGRLALQRGPLVYALEGVDQSGVALRDIMLSTTAAAVPEQKPDLLGGVTVLKMTGLTAEKPLVREPLYQPLNTAANRRKKAAMLTFIPFYAINNRETTPVSVWIPAADVYGGNGK